MSRLFSYRSRATLGALWMLSALLHSAPAQGKKSEAPALQVGESIAVAETTTGKVRGFVLNGIHAFRGIPYGADTSGENRFMPPQKPVPWTGVRPALWWGPSAPQDMKNRFANTFYAFTDHWNYDEISEDCLRLNVWTPALKDGKKRPVLVWLHGGGFTAGNGIEQDGYDGENFARMGDVVFCSINHRLGALGFSDFASIDPKLSHSGNVGMLDIVAALAWVRDNITHFGGDPGNVTIMGQSGGGAKVCTLMAMPAAKGLFHKAVALSGSSLAGIPKARAEELGAAILAEAGLNPSEFGKLQQMPWADYLALAERAARKVHHPEVEWPRQGFAPVGDGLDLRSEAFFGDDLSASVPTLFCSTFNESAPSREDASLESINLDGVKEKLRPRFKERTEAIVEAYARTFPKAKPVEIWSLIASNRQGVVRAGNAKAAQKAPVYMAWFGWQPPLFDARMRAFHCADISFWFANTDRMVTHTGGGARPRRLSTAMAKTLTAFMKSGGPNGGGLPKWPVYTPQVGATMVLDDVSKVQNDPDRQARQALELK